MGTEVKKIKDTKITVIELLSSHPKKEIYKDQDEALISRVWTSELSKMGKLIDKISAREFLNIFSTNQLTSSETIVRARRLAQNECEELRGKIWYERHKEEEEVRDAAGNEQL